MISVDSNEPSGSHSTIKSPENSSSAFRHDHPYPWRDSKTSRAPVPAISSEVPTAALLLQTTTSSTNPVAKKRSMQTRIDSFSLYVGRATETFFSFHMASPDYSW